MMQENAVPEVRVGNSSTRAKRRQHAQFLKRRHCFKKKRRVHERQRSFNDRSSEQRQPPLAALDVNVVSSNTQSDQRGDEKVCVNVRNEVSL